MNIKMEGVFDYMQLITVTYKERQRNITRHSTRI
jgi:hypothetical protein